VHGKAARHLEGDSAVGFAAVGLGVGRALEPKTAGLYRRLERALAHGRRSREAAAFWRGHPQHPRCGELDFALVELMSTTSRIRRLRRSAFSRRCEMFGAGGCGGRGADAEAARLVYLGFSAKRNGMRGGCANTWRGDALDPLHITPGTCMRCEGYESKE
jgi:hypothetical protein